jgi:hypothetical protein
MLDAGRQRGREARRQEAKMQRSKEAKKQGNMGEASTADLGGLDSKL